MKIIKHRTPWSNVGYEKMYGIKPKSLHYSFSCNEQGEVDESKLHPAAVENYNACKNGTKTFNGQPIELLEIKRFEQEGYDPAVGICDKCEAKIELYDPMTNTCDCGAEYNGSGQRLEDRRLWDDTDGATSPDYE